MATFTGSYNVDLSTDAQFRALWGDVDSHLQSLGGWTYVSQTGDGDPSTAATGAAGTYPVFRCYSTTVGSETWYMRLDFGHNSNGASFKHQFGSGLNGSGTLTGQTSTQTTETMSGSGPGSAGKMFMSQAAGRFMMYVGDPTSIRSVAVSVCGGLDGSGAMSSGLDIFGCNDQQVQAQAIPASGTIPGQRTMWPVNIDDQADKTVGGVVFTGHPILWVPGGARNPTLAVGVGGSSNSTNGLTTQCNLYAAAHTYLATITPFNVTLGGSSNNKPLWLYE